MAHHRRGSGRCKEGHCQVHPVQITKGLPGYWWLHADRKRFPLERRLIKQYEPEWSGFYTSGEVALLNQGCTWLGWPSEKNMLGPGRGLA